LAHAGAFYCFLRFLPLPGRKAGQLWRQSAGLAAAAPPPFAFLYVCPISATIKPALWPQLKQSTRRQ